MTDNRPDTEQPSRRKLGVLIETIGLIIILYFCAPTPFLTLLAPLSSRLPPRVAAVERALLIDPINWLSYYIPAYAQWIDWQSRFLGLK